jgi:hypothetical protein
MRDALGEVTADKVLCDHFVALENTTRHKLMTCEAKITQRTKQHHPYTFSEVEGGRIVNTRDAVPSRLGITQMPVGLSGRPATVAVHLRCRIACP